MNVFNFQLFLTGVLTSVLTFSLPPLAHAQIKKDIDRKLDIPPAEPVIKLLREYCIDCHGKETREAGLRFDQITGFQENDQALWTRIYHELNGNSMPPEGSPRPDKVLFAGAVTSIEKQQIAILSTGSIRRLNRRELSSALQDLTGLKVNYKDSLPEDGKIDGFDIAALALQDAASSVQQMVRVTRQAVDGISLFPDESENKKSFRFQANLMQTRDTRRALDSWKALGAKSKIRGFAMPEIGLLLETKWLGERGGCSFTVPIPDSKKGILRLKLSVAHQKYFDDLPNPHLWVEIGGKKIAYCEIESPETTELEFQVQMDELGIQRDGLKIELVARVEVPYQVKGFDNDHKLKPDQIIPGGPGVFRPKFNRKDAAEKQPVPFVVLKEIEIDSDFQASWPPPAWKLDLPISRDQVSAKSLLAAWMERAYRRPVSAKDLAPFNELFRKLRGNGMAFEDALKATFHSVLLSGAFRYLPAPHDEASRDTHYAIASRLSFMFTGGPPDERLLELAATKRLLDARTLDREVDRLLASPQRRNFFGPFVVQWLRMDQPITLTMDYFEKQDFRFGRLLKESMRQETIQYVERMTIDDRPLRELIDSDWSVWNNSLGRHYGHPEIRGGELRKVKLDKNHPRGGGILSHAGIQSMLCWMGDNWVIYRGAWTLRHILNDPPPSTTPGSS